MTLGLVKCFDAHKGSGLITPDGGGPEVFVHVSAVERAGLASLDAGVAQASAGPSNSSGESCNTKGAARNVGAGEQARI